MKIIIEITKTNPEIKNAGELLKELIIDIVDNPSDWKHTINGLKEERKEYKYSAENHDGIITVINN